MATTEFYNAGKHIKVVYISGPNNGVIYFMPKVGFTFYKTNTSEFTIRSGTTGIYVIYSEVSTTNPAGHASIDDLFAIFETWCLDEDDENTINTGLDDQHRQRIVEPKNVFEFNFRHNTEPRKFNTLVANSGTVTFVAAEQYADLTSSGAANSRAVIQTKKYMAFQEGKSFQIQIAALMRATLAVAENSVKLGYYDALADKTNLSSEQSASGVFLTLDGAGALSLVRRDYIGAAENDTTIAQTSWNIDPLDGTGPSGFNLDITKINVYIFEILADSAGTIRFGVLSGNGSIYYAHRFKTINTLGVGSIFNASLPVRMEILDSATGGDGSTARLYNGCVVSEGGYDIQGIPFSVDRGNSAANVVVLKTSTDIKPIVTIRPKAAKCRTTLIPMSFTVLNFRDNAVFRYRLVLNGTLTASSFVSTDLPADSSAEYDISATAITGGTTLVSGYVAAKRDKIEIDPRDRLELYTNIQGTLFDTLSIVVEYINSDCQIMGAVDWLEIK